MTTPEERKARWMAEGMTESQAAFGERMHPGEGAWRLLSEEEANELMSRRDERLAKNKARREEMIKSRISNACCENEKRSMNGGCINCGAPCI
jgi:hypothetical protein